MKWVQFEQPVGGLSMWRNAKYDSEVDSYTKDNTADLEQYMVPEVTLSG